MDILKKTHGKAGFTLIEILLAILVLSVGLAGMIPVLINTTKGNAFARTATEAATYSQDKLEELRRVEFDNTDLDVGTHTDPDPPSGYTRQWRVVDACGGTCPDVKIIEVCTALTSGGRGEKTFSDVCFTASPLTSYHYFSVRANL